jgi:hypothetical protein
MLKPEGFQQMPAHADKWADWEEQCRETIRPGDRINAVEQQARLERVGEIEEVAGLLAIRPAVQQEYPLSKSRCGLCVD